MDGLGFVVTFFVTLCASVLSGAAGGGGGFVTTPYWLLIGMTPAQGAGTGACMATGMSMSSAAAFRRACYTARGGRLILALLVATLFGSLLGIWLVPHIPMQPFRYSMGVIAIVALPLLFRKPGGALPRPRHHRIGGACAAGLAIVGSIMPSSAFSLLFTIVLIRFFSLSVLEATSLRRVTGIVQSVVLCVGFAAQDHVVWQHAAVGLLGGGIGSYIGTRYAIKKGEQFATYTLAGVSLVGGVALLI